ncbi:MAG: response regulator [Pseudomonadota bacterium]
MKSAEKYLVSKPAPSPAISIDKVTRDKIAKYFTDLQNGLENNSLSRDELIEKIVEGELSEWNNVFLYVINVLKEHVGEFKYCAARIQAHIKKIEYFLETIENRPEALKKLTGLPSVWVENILIVDDDQLITELLQAILNRSGKIDIAHNGQEALKLMDEKFYKLIISDVDMPVMNGISFFKEAVAKFPKLKNRFLFITGYVSPQNQSFFNEYNLKYLAKPMRINALREKASKIILSS